MSLAAGVDADCPAGRLNRSGSRSTACTAPPVRPGAEETDPAASLDAGAGGAVAASGATSLARAHAVTVKNTTDTRVYVVAVSGPTAYVGMYDKR